MKASWMLRTQALGLVLGLLLCANAFAQDAPADQGQDVQAELKALKAEIAALRGEMKQVLTEVRSIKQGQARQQPQQPQPQQRQPDTTVYDIDLAGAPVRGPADAKVTIVEYVDFQCPYCAREAPVIKQVMDAYPKDVKFAFKHFPLGFHKQAKPAHAAAALAMKQKGNDAFWQMHDLILADAKKIDVADLRAHAETVGLDLKEFDDVMADPAKIDELLKADMTGAAKYKVRGTPSVFINGLKLSPRGLDNYKARIEEILKGGDKKAEAKPPVRIQVKPVDQ